MVLVDTSVWIEHLRFGEGHLAELLAQNLVLTHPFLIGELACASLRNRTGLLADLERLPAAPTADHAEVLQFVERRRLWGKGVGWVDVHLVASALLSGSRLWTLDRALERIADGAGINYSTTQRPRQGSSPR